MFFWKIYRIVHVGVNAWKGKKVGAWRQHEKADGGGWFVSFLVRIASNSNNRLRRIHCFSRIFIQFVTFCPKTRDFEGIFFCPGKSSFFPIPKKERRKRTLIFWFWDQWGMERVMNILKPKPNPQQLLRDWQRRLRQECRNIERQIRGNSLPKP